MKQSILLWLVTLMLLGGFSRAQAEVTPSSDYKETFSTGNTTKYTKYTDVAGYPQRYWFRHRTGTAKTMAQNTAYDADASAATKRCIGYSTANNGTNSELLCPPEVGGSVTFKVRRNYTSASASYKSQLEIFIMEPQADGTWTRKSLATEDGTFDGITVTGVTAANNITNLSSQNNYNWLEVKLTGVPDNTRLGIRLQYLYMDDFTATKAWLEWPAKIKDFTVVPIIDVMALPDQTLIPLDKNGTWNYKTKIQLQTNVIAGKLTADDLKYTLQLYFNGKTPDHIDLNELQFTKVPEEDWNYSGQLFEIQDIELNVTLPAELFNVNTFFRLYLDESYKPTAQRRTSGADDGKWNSAQWSSVKFEGYVPQPKFGYNPYISTNSSGVVTNVTVTEPVKNFPMSLNPVANEAPVAIVNNAGSAPMTITKVEFSEPDRFALKDKTLTFPKEVSAKSVLELKPELIATKSGAYTATMSVYVDGFAEPYTILIEGVKKADGKASYAFHNTDGTPGALMPKGWLATGKWGIKALSMYYHKTDTWTESAYVDNQIATDLQAPWTLASPKLKFEENDQVWFDAVSSSDIEVLYSTDRANWQVLKTLTPAPYNLEDGTDISSMFSAQGSSGYGQEKMMRTFGVTVPQAGEGYIAFRAANTGGRIDNFVGGEVVAVDFDLAYITAKPGFRAFVNGTNTYSFTVRNLADEIAADAYSVVTLIDGKEVKTDKGAAALPTSVDVEIPVSFVFPETGKHKVQFKLVKGENTVATPEFEVEVLAELNQEKVQIGTSHKADYIADDYYGTWSSPNTSNMVKYEALYTTNLLKGVKKNGASEANGSALYNADDPEGGLVEGDKILTLSWPGYLGATDNRGRTHATFPLKVWLENSSNNTITTTFTDTDFMTCVFDGQAAVDFSKTGNDRTIKEDYGSNVPVDMKDGVITIVLDKPFEYTGGNLRLVYEIPQVYFDENNPVEGAVYTDWSNFSNNYYNANSAYLLTSNDPSGTPADQKSTMVYYGKWGNSTTGYVPIVLIGKEVQPATISGKVTNQADGSAIEGAVVTAKNETGSVYTATSEADGSYSLAIGNADGKYKVTATKEGFHNFFSADEFNMVEGNKTFNLVMRETAIKISGKVLGEEGALEGATVVLKHALSDASQTTTTDANGAYEFKTELITTDHILTVTAPYHVAAEKRVPVGDVNVNVDDITLARMTATISGTVKGDDGLLEGAKVTIKDVKTNLTSETVTDTNGAYSFTVKGLDTDYEITVTAKYYDTYTGRQAIGVVDVTVPEIVLTHSVVNVSGTVKGDDGMLEGAKVTLTLGDESLEATTGADGAYEFTVKNLDTDYTIAVSAPYYEDYTGTVAVGVVDVIVPEIVLNHIVVSVGGKVVDESGNAIAGAAVTFATGDDIVLEATTDADGVFSFSTKLLDTEWTLTVKAEGYDEATQAVSVATENIDLGEITLKKTLGIGAVYADAGITIVPGAGCIEISANGAKVIVADTMGRVIRVIGSLNGKVTVDGLTAGIYLVNHTKVAVR